MIKIVYRAIDYPDGVTAVYVYSPELKHADYRGSFSLPTATWQAMKGCIEVGVEGNPLEFDAEFVGRDSLPT
jgi:hypothetical protein